jgi:RNA polymerase sigma-70 factor (ECF subfamily)
VTSVSERALGDGILRQRTRYLSPEDVFEHDYDRLVQALTIVTGDREVAADAVQEAFVRLVRGWDRISSYEDPAGWVRRVALNQIRDHHRSIWRQARLLLKMEQQYHIPGGGSPTDERLWERLGTLPLKQRTALSLYCLDHLTTREVAQYNVMLTDGGLLQQ